MTNNLLLKGFEVELFTGRSNGENVGVSVSVTRELPDFATEPDKRNLEYITTPKKDYSQLKQELLIPRRKLREWLSPRQLTIFPGSTLSLGNSKIFERSDPLNPYHQFIEENYGTKVVTASVHINIGINDLVKLFAAIRLIRCEAALFLALSASSPFLDGVPTGVHSQRWLQFPLTPKSVPMFLSHEHYVKWVEQELLTGGMINERHLWTSVRPNGPRRPYQLNRLELRICDLITDPSLLLAITALIELRVLGLLQNPNQLDPLHKSSLNPSELAELSVANDLLAAQSSLDAPLLHWEDGRQIICREWINQLLESVQPLAIDMKMAHLLTPIFRVLKTGNTAMQWLDAFKEINSVQDILQSSILEMEKEELLIAHPEALVG